MAEYRPKSLIDAIEMQHLGGEAPGNLRYKLHVYAALYGKMGWEIERAINRGDVSLRDVLREMTFAAADSRGRKRRADNEAFKAQPARGRRHA